MAVVTVAYSELNSWLQAQPENTTDTPYEIEVTGLLLPGNIENVGESLRDNITKYVDLRETNLPFFDTEISDIFHGCINLVYPPTIPDGTEELNATFLGCSNLKEIPELPNSCHHLDSTFYQCTSLQEVFIPNGLSYMVQCFYGCTSLVKANIPPSRVVNDSVYVIAINRAFYGCTHLKEISICITKTSLEEEIKIGSKTSAFFNCNNLTDFKTDQPYEAKQWLITNKTSLSFAQDVDSCNFYLLSEPAIIPFNKLNNELSALSANTAQTAYKLDVSELTARDVDKSTTSGTLGNVIKTNSTKYVDLFYTKIPSSVTKMNLCFSDCNNLTTSPNIPNSVTNMSGCFVGCSSLTTAPTIPNSVANMFQCFYGCSSLTIAPTIPSSVTNMSACFQRCLSLTIVPTIPSSVTNMSQCFSNCISLTKVPNIPGSVTDISYCFFNDSLLEEITLFEANLETLIANDKAVSAFVYCESLAKIGIPAEPPVEEYDWHCFRLSFDSNSVQGKVYDKTGTAVTISQTAVTKSTLKLPIKTDELWFPTGYTDAQIDDIIENVIWYRYSYFNDSNVLDPSKKNFVLWADDPDNVMTNITTDIDYPVPVDKGGTGQTDLADVNVGSATTATRLGPIGIDNIRIGSAQAKITLEQLMTWFITTKAYIPSGVSCFKTFRVPWSYANNDILQLSIDGNNYELQLAGCIIEFFGNATNYNSGIFRLRIHSSPALSFTATSGYSKFPVNHIAEYTCNGSDYSPAWKMILEQGDSARAISGAVTCSTAAGTAAKTVTLPGFRLTRGARLSITLSNANTVASALTLNVNETGAKTIRWNGTVTSSSTYAMTATTYNCYYDGTYWNMDSGYEAYSARTAGGCSGNSATADTTRGTAYCTTAGATQAKVASMRGFVLQSGATFPITFTNANSYNGVITLNVNSTGAKNIYINNLVSSSSNKTLPAGTYLCRYDGSYYYIDTGYFVTNARNAATSTWTKGETMRPTTANLYPKSKNGSLTHFLATSSMTTEKPATDGHIIHMSWDSNGGWGAQMFLPDSATGVPQYRAEAGGTWTAWKNFITADNIGSQTVATATTANKIRTSAPSNPSDGDIWIE